MELVDDVKELLMETAKSLKGSACRLFMARTVRALGEGGKPLAERELGWNRGTIRQGQHELEHGFFALIPGGEATLGYDREHPFLPNAHQQASWVQETQQTGMFTEALDVFLDKVMTPLRHVRVEPFLLEVLATPLAPAPIFDATLGRQGGWSRTVTPITAEKTLQRLSSASAGECLWAVDRSLSLSLGVLCRARAYAWR